MVKVKIIKSKKKGHLDIKKALKITKRNKTILAVVKRLADK
ncbi:MAG: hypothetical protein MRERV_25c007 [Mycoplasmataceae bacterium RV_VA103A]|nr:MAG: hypothetical protein MRERV_25c007 [Mycoplasmataceae bacterium RV_VA103A]